MLRIPLILIWQLGSHMEGNNKIYKIYDVTEAWEY